MKKLNELILSIPSCEAICYTDGSALINPGPAGAGASLMFPGPSGPVLVERAVSLGFSTNNVGELWAIAMAIRMAEGEEHRLSMDPVPLHIITDSKYSIGIIQGSAVNANALLANKVKGIIKLRRKKTRVTLHWVKGHLNIDGNEQADMLAKSAARGSRGITVDLKDKILRDGFLY